MKKKNFCIIGAGWYGCHIGLYLKDKGHNVKIFEKESRIFSGSSGFNQFRLHKGFHYPRSSETIDEIKKITKDLSKNTKILFIIQKIIYIVLLKKFL